MNDHRMTNSIAYRLFFRKVVLPHQYRLCKSKHRLAKGYHCHPFHRDGDIYQLGDYYATTGALCDKYNIIGQTYSVLNDFPISTALRKHAYDLSSRVLIGQGPTLNSPGHLEIWDGSDWVRPTKWQVVGNTADKPIGQLTVNEIIKGQLKAVEYLSGMTFFMNDAKNSFLFPHLAIKYKNNYYVFQGGEINLMRDSFTGEWWKISDFS
jgi:hypothetical protein